MTTFNLSVHQLIELQVFRTPDRIAVQFEGQQLTYRELNDKANQVAHYLIDLGVKPEVLVGIYIERSLEMLIGMLGVLKAGGAYVPLDPAFPAERISFMLEDSQLPIILTQGSLEAYLPSHQAQVVRLDKDWETIAPYSVANPVTAVTPDNLAYLLYTSGSTGNPKGVLINHRSVVNLLLAMEQEPGLTMSDRILATTTISFDIAVLELLLPLIVGAEIYMVSRAVASDPIQLSQVITQSGVTVAQGTPSTWRMLLAVNWQGDPNLKIFCGGEILTQHLATQLLERSSSLWNMYAPTETTTYSTVHKVQLGDNPVPIGHPILNTQLYIIKYPARRKGDVLKCVTDNSEGELYIGGVGVARGYLNRPDLTTERFIPDTFSDDPEARLYKTGDLARSLPNGDIVILGRNDYQVKVRGHRIEIGDIEAACLQHKSVKDVVVVAREDAYGENRLIAYVVLHADAPHLTSAELRVFLKEKLPDYMVPALVVFIDALPLTPNFKVDRRALPVPNLDEMEDIVPPRTETEEQLVKIWNSVLGVEVGIYQNFFESGGDSVGTAILLNQISQAFHIDLSLDCLFKSPTIAGLAEVIEVVRASGSTSAFDTTPAELLADASLDETISPITIDRFRPRKIFLTGATGFVGAFLLDKLLRYNPQATIYCLVRGRNLEAATSRLRRTLEGYELWQPEFESRIVLVLGDLAQPLFGLSESQFLELADTIDVIYHSGAYVNLVYPYIALKDTNVGGTQEVLRLATLTKITPVHYLSTIDVFQSSNYREQELLLESDELISAEGYSDGYAQSKWAAEKLVRGARNRGVPVCIYRLTMVTGHSKTGSFQLSNLICRLIKGLIQLEYAPELDLNMNLAPVDYIVQAICHLSHQPQSLGKTFHLINSQPLSMHQLILDLNALGYGISSIPYPQWQAKLLTMSPDNALTPTVSMFVRTVPHNQKTFIETTSFVAQTFDSRNTQEGLKGTDIICPPVDRSVLKNYLSYLMRQGFLGKQHQPVSRV
jgi:amino acid adenylation domain-containing protein/thioester reductase-like protein